MKQLLTISLFLFSLSAFSQVDTTRNHVIINRFYDTVKVKIYYEDGNYLKILHNGIAIRHVETNSKQDGGKILSIVYYDDKMKKFSKPVAQVFAQ